MKANLVCREGYPIGYQANCHQPHGVNENHTTGHSGSLGRHLIQLVLLEQIVQIVHVQAVQLGQLGLRDERVIGYQGRLSPLHSV